MTTIQFDLNVPQSSFLQLPHKFKAYVAGFGSGKTFVGCAGICAHFWQWPGINQGYFAPTYPQIRDIFYPTMEEVAYAMGLRIKVKQGDHEVEVYEGRLYRGTVICRSMEKPETIVGFKIGHALIDEGLPRTLAERVQVRDTPAMAKLLKEDFKDKGHQVKIFPDASGQNTSSKNASESDLSILRQAGFLLEVNHSNPAVKDRVNAYNGMILNAQGERRWKINTDQCPTTTEALEQQVWGADGQPDKKSGHDHPNDANGYFLVKRYAPRIAPLVQRIATAYGKAADRFTLADLDLANLAAFDAAHPQLVGLYVADRTNQAQAIQQLAASVGAQAVMSRTGQLRLVQIALPAAGVPVEIGPDQMLQDSLRPVQRLPVVAAVKIGFDKNWTAQNSLTTSIPAAHADLYATEWLTETAVDEAVRARYRLTDDPPQIDTCLKANADAQAEAARRLALNKVQRTIYEFDGEPEMMMLELGQPVVLRDDRFGLQDGAPGVVVLLSPQWLTGRVTVGVLV